MNESTSESKKGLKETLQNMGSNAAKLAVGAKIALETSAGLGAEAVDNTATVEDKNLTSVERTFESNASEKTDEATISFEDGIKGLSTDPVENTKEANPESGGEGGIENLEAYRVDITESFELGKGILEASQVSGIESQLSGFFSSLPESVKTQLENGNLVVRVSSSCSPEKIVEGGIDAGNGTIVYNNEDLARVRAELGGALSESTMQQSGVRGTIEFSIPVGGVDLDNPTRRVEISIELKANPSPERNDSEVEDLSQMNLDNVAYVVIDRSRSMKAEADVVSREVETYNRNFNGQVEIINLKADKETGTIEDHYGTLKDILDGIQKPFAQQREIHFYTDEYQNKYIENFKDKMDVLIAKAKELNLKVILHTYEAGDTKVRTDRELASADQLMGRNMKRGANTDIAFEDNKDE